MTWHNLYNQCLQENPLDNLSPELASKVQRFLNAVLSFCRDVMSLEAGEAIPKAYLSSDVEKMYGSDMHMYTHVSPLRNINLLHRYT